MKKPEEILKYNYDNVTLRAGDLGEFSGAHFKLVPGPGPKGLIARLLPSIAIRNSRDEGFTHFTKREALSGAWKNRDVDWRRGVRFYGDDASIDEMKSALAASGVALTRFRPIELHESGSEGVEVSQEFRITSEVRRGIAKIAFNYLAFRQKASYVLDRAFDPVREFIRHGTVEDDYFVNTTLDLPFQTNVPDGQRPVVHWVSLDSHESHHNLLGTVMLFGFLEHSVMLAESFRGPWFDIPVAHLYNIKTLSVQEMSPRTPRWRIEDT